MRRQILCFLLAVTALAFIAGAMMPGELRETARDALYLSSVDQYAHLFFCGLMALLLVMLRVPPIAVVLILLALGALVELVQIWIPGRSPTWADFIDDGVGTLVGVGVAWLLGQWKRLTAGVES